MELFPHLPKLGITEQPLRGLNRVEVGLCIIHMPIRQEKTGLPVSVNLKRSEHCVELF